MHIIQFLELFGVLQPKMEESFISHPPGGVHKGGGEEPRVMGRLCISFGSQSILEC